MSVITTTAPPIVAHLIARFLIDPEERLINEAHEEAAHIVESIEEPWSQVAEFVQRVAEAALQHDDPQLVKDGSDYTHAGSTFQNAFQEPAFCLGFSLAYLLFVERGAVR